MVDQHDAREVQKSADGQKSSFSASEVHDLYAQLGTISLIREKGSSSAEVLDMGNVQSLYGDHANWGNDGAHYKGTISSAPTGTEGTLTGGRGKEQSRDGVVTAVNEYGRARGDWGTITPVKLGGHSGGDGGGTKGHGGDGGSGGGTRGHGGGGGTGGTGGDGGGSGGGAGGGTGGDTGGNTEKIKIGAYVKPQGGETGSQAFSNMESQVGEKLGVDNFYMGFGQPLSNRVEQDIKNGVEPMISLTSGDVKAIASGKDDAYLKQLADQIKSDGGNVMLRYGYEMDNGHVEPGAKSASDFVAAWQHIHDVFQREGATNAKMVWCPTAAGYKSGKADAYFPGSKYVDAVGCDGYNRSATDPRSPQDIFQPFVDFAAKNAPGKPLVIGETGTVGTPEQKASWLKEMQQWSSKVPNMSAVVYWDSTNPSKGWDYSINNPTDESALKQLVNNG